MTTVSSCKMIDALMYGMMPSAKIEKRSSAPPENRLTSPNMVLRRLLEELRQRFAVDPWSRDRDADAIHRQHGKGEQQPAPELRNPPGVLRTLQPRVMTSAVPPAACKRSLGGGAELVRL